MKNKITISQPISLETSSYFQQIKNYQSKFKLIPTIVDMVNNVLSVDTDLQAGILPDHLPFLEINDQMVSAVQQQIITQYPNQPTLGNQLWNQKIEELMGLDHLLHGLRDELIKRYKMYGYVSSPAVEYLSKYLAGRKTLELMAGYGYLSVGLKSIQPLHWIHAVDNESWQFQPQQSLLPPQSLVEKMDALDALKHYGSESEVIILSWSPDQDEIDLELLAWVRENFSGEFLVLGEFKGATNSQAFWDKANLEPMEEYNQRFKSFDLIDEKLYRVK
ncbi:hypothetical protein [Weissella koreensis]|uniref:Uncharacterized protein n=1 Tax=Weissella koreensis TaxID=165096 RepID=A0A7H1MLG8_9LACO|nr:hypothetical protein [Weissella koreensis]AVH75100.1 hypothetical protein C4597_03265 [Weissella koreensis]EJF33510.1 hypothetical protein JC2156_08720 [Weissella koreensis KCTC 3621]QGN20326.1 hypothetical protein GKC51_03250 [Weissella koreensis]QNT64304.1 hypothetical protein FY536_02970 [Weissella koreensis]